MLGYLNGNVNKRYFYLRFIMDTNFERGLLFFWTVGGGRGSDSLVWNF